MPYRDSLNRWLVVRLLPNMQRITVVAFCKRADAEGYLQAVRRLVPQAQFVIMFNAEAQRQAGQPAKPKAQEEGRSPSPSFSPSLSPSISLSRPLPQTPSQTPPPLSPPDF
jgi:hypothetical protein